VLYECRETMGDNQAILNEEGKDIDKMRRIDRRREAERKREGIGQNE